MRLQDSFVVCWLLAGACAGCMTPSQTARVNDSQPMALAIKTGTLAPTIAAPAAIELTAAASTPIEESAVLQVAAVADFDGQATFPADGGMTLEDLESLALQYNPAIKELTATTQKAAGYRAQVVTRPNRSVGYQGQQLADQRTDQQLAYVEKEFVTGGSSN